MKYLWLHLVIMLILLGVFNPIGSSYWSEMRFVTQIFLPCYSMIVAMVIFVSAFFRKEKKWLQTIMLTLGHILVSATFLFYLFIAIAGAGGSNGRS